VENSGLVRPAGPFIEVKQSTSMIDKSPLLFWPQEIGPYEADLHELLHTLTLTDNPLEACHFVRQHLTVIPQYQQADVQHLRYRAYLLVLHDLLRQGWIHICRHGQLFLEAPTISADGGVDENLNSQKELLREMLHHERRAQIAKPSVQEFIRMMERSRFYNGQEVSIRVLFADGPNLVRELQRVIALPTRAEQEMSITTAIQPYLQLVNANDRCQFTGLRLIDIWRYMRHTWSLPYYSTPGRNMFYLVRDAAQPFHPIIAIAALGNSMMQLTVRDNKIGWTSQAVFNRINAASSTDLEASTIVQTLQLTLSAALEDIAISDLVSPRSIERPTDETLENLESIADRARIRRIEVLQELRRLGRPGTVIADQLPLPGEGMPPPTSDIEHLQRQAQEALFLHKRARALRTLLASRMAITQTSHNITTIEGLREFIRTPAGGQAVQTLIRENKKRRIGINMMDLIVCGALPPYNFLLGGKLAAMLMVSPRIIHDYRQKYQGAKSNIASKMKQAEVVRDPKLVFLGTTSLYHVGSSQYNRIAIPLLDSNTTKITYQEYGKTLGFGSIHFSEAAIQALNELQQYVNEATLINNVFGEGINPKFRRITAGLSAIGLTHSDRFVNHGSKRIVYGVPLGRRTHEFLRGETDDPEYFFDVQTEEVRTEAEQHIATTWAVRWLLMRVEQSSVLNAVEQFDVAQMLLSTTIPQQIEEMA
jgi:hypothetical protein